MNQDNERQDDLDAQAQFLNGGITSGFLGGVNVKALLDKPIVPALVLPACALMINALGNPAVPFGSVLCGGGGPLGSMVCGGGVPFGSMVCGGG